MDEERKGLPSSSSMDRYHSCAGSLPLERLLRKRGELPRDEDNEAASHGRLIHEICEEIFFTESNLAPGRYRKEHIDEAQGYVAVARSLPVIAWGEDEGAIKFYLEKRLYLRDEYEISYSTGKPDVVMVKDDEAIVIDYKTGWGQLPFAGESWQLKSYAVMVAQEYDVETVRVAFIKKGAIDSEHTFSQEDLSDLTVFEFPRLLLGHNENPFVGTGYSPDPETCRYCACKLKCPALNAQFMIMEPRKEVSDVFLPELANHAKLEEMKEALGQLEVFSKALDQEITSRLQDDPDSFESWHLAPGRGRRTVKDPSSLCGQLIEDGASPDDIYEVLKIGVTDAEKLHKQITKLKGKMAKTDFNSRYSDHIETQPGRETLKRKPPTIEN